MLSLLSWILITTPVQIDVKLGSQPLPHHAMEAVGFLNGAPKFRLQKFTNDNGRATFDLDPRQPAVIVIRTTFEGLPYLSPIFAAAALPSAPLSIQVFHTKASDPGFKISDRRLALEQSGDWVRVDESLVLNNPSSSTLIGVKAKGSEEALSFTIQLPPAAKDFRFVSGLDQGEAHFAGQSSALAIGHPFPPGRSFISYRYYLPSKSKLDLTLSSSVRSDLISLAIAKADNGGETNIEASSAFSDDLYVATITQKEVGDNLMTLYEVERTRTAPSNSQVFSFPLVALGFKDPWTADAALPFIPLAALLTLTWVISRRKDPKASEPSSRKKLNSAVDKETLLMQLRQLERARTQGSLGPLDIEYRRIEILEELAPFYEPQL